MFDYKDQLSLTAAGFPRAVSEPRHCLLTGDSSTPLPTKATVQAQAAEWRERWYCLAGVAEDSLGPLPDRVTHAGHDRDYRSTNGLRWASPCLTLICVPALRWCAAGNMTALQTVAAGS